MGKLLTFFAFLMLNFNLFADHLEGNYHVSGFDPYTDSHYTGEARIVKNGDTYVIIWHYPNGEGVWTIVGTGVLKDGQLSFVSQDVASPSYIGLQVYEIHHDGKKLHGPWLYYGDVKIGKETLCKVEVN